MHFPCVEKYYYKTNRLIYAYNNFQKISILIFIIITQIKLK